MMATPSNALRNRRLNDIRNNLKQVPLMKKLATKLSMQNQNTFSQPSINDHDCLYEKQTNTTPSEINTSNAIYKNKLICNSFDDKYDLFEKLGEGANGCVYRCQHRTNKKMFAVKKFKVSEDNLLETKRNFIHVQKLNHPNICSYKALYFNNSQTFAYLVMESFPFPTLEGYSLKSEEQLKLIVRQLVAAIRYLHQHHICHRDFKPQNILYDHHSGKVKIVDFGIAKKTISRGVSREMLTIIGTNFYVAPEIYLGGGYDQKIDLWALGVTIYKLITGHTPFESQYQSNTIANILKGDIKFQRKIWENYSPFAKDFVSRTLKQKNQRLSAAQCQIHLWLQFSETDLPKKLSRASSFRLLSDHFKVQNRNAERGKSQEGSHKVHQCMLKKIKSINVNDFDLQGSEDEQCLLKKKGLKNSQHIF